MDLEQIVLQLEQTSNLYGRLLIVRAKTLALEKSPLRTAILQQVEKALKGPTRNSVSKVAKLIRPNGKELYVEYNAEDHTWSEACTIGGKERVRNQFMRTWLLPPTHDESCPSEPSDDNPDEYSTW